MKRTKEQENAIFEIIGMYLADMRKARTLEELDYYDNILTGIICTLRRLDLLSLDEMLNTDKTSGKLYIATSKALKARTA